MSTERESLADGSYRVLASRFVAGVRIVDGRVNKLNTAPILSRLRGMDAAAFFRYALDHGWRVERDVRRP